VHFVHSIGAVVGFDGVAEFAAAEQCGKELVEMGEEEAIRRVSTGSKGWI
jgi:hypothetical protein